MKISMWIGLGKQTGGNYFSVYLESLICFKIDSKEG